VHWPFIRRATHRREIRRLVFSHVRELIKIRHTLETLQQHVAECPSCRASMARIKAGRI